MIRELEGEGHDVVITCRPLANTIDLLDLHGFRYEVVGVHSGGKFSMKLFGFPIRVWQLWRYTCAESASTWRFRRAPSTRRWLRGCFVCA